MDANLCEVSQTPGATGYQWGWISALLRDSDYTAQFQGMGQLESISQSMLYDRKISSLWSYKFSWWSFALALYSANSLSYFL